MVQGDYMGIRKNRLSVNNRQPFLKATGIVFILVAVVLMQIPVPAIQANENGNDFRLDGSTLVEYSGDNSSVSIPAKVSVIGAEVFADHQEIKVLTIPDTVTRIETGAFSGCTALESVIIPDSVVAIGSSAFNGCTKLKKMSIGKGLDTLGAGAFSDCDTLEGISVNAENPNFVFENGILYSKDKTLICQVVAGKKADNLSIPDTVTSIMPYSFWGCDKIKSVSLSASMPEIGPYAFSNCTSIESVEIPYSVRSIELKAFSDCINLNDVVIPKSVISVHATAFDGCLLLQPENDGSSDQVSSNQVDENQTDQVESVTETSGVGQSVTKQTQESVSANDQTQDQETKTETTTATTAEVENVKILGKTVIVGKNAVILMNNKNSSVYSGDEYQKAGVSENKVISEDGNTIMKQSYYRDDTLTEFTIPEGVRAIEEFAFARSALNKILIPEGIETIGYAAFYHCDQLSAVEIPVSVIEIENKAFSKTPWMENWMTQGEDDFLVAGDGILLAYKGDDVIVMLPDSVKQIASGAFENHEEIEEVILTSNVWAIRDYAFLNCSSLSVVTGGENVTLLEELAFEGTNVLVTKENIASVQNASSGTLGEYHILNKSDVNNSVFLKNSLKWITIIALLSTSAVFLFIKKKRS